jgi:hypothetical protein
MQFFICIKIRRGVFPIGRRGEVGFRAQRAIMLREILASSLFVVVFGNPFDCAGHRIV